MRLQGMRSQGMRLQEVRLQRTRGSRNEGHWLRPKFLSPSALLLKKGLPLSLVAARFVATRDRRWHRRAALRLRSERRGIRDRAIRRSRFDSIDSRNPPRIRRRF